MQKIGDMLHLRDRRDFGEGDHQEYVEPGIKDVLLIAAAAVLMVGGFVWTLATG